MSDGEFAAFKHIERGSFEERIAKAHVLKEEGNVLLNAGDYEEALPKYVEGLYHLQFHERAMAMVKLPQADTDRLNAARVPLLLNSVLCELRMNPEEQTTRRLEIAERRCADVLAEQPNNTKALFRRAQLHGRAGEYSEASSLLERLCKLQPTERAFRTELAAVVARSRKQREDTSAFWSGALGRLDSANKLARASEDLENGATFVRDSAAGAAQWAPLARLASLMAPLWQLWFWLCQRGSRALEEWRGEKLSTA